MAKVSVKNPIKEEMTEIVEAVEGSEAVQPDPAYTFRKLGAPDIFLMVKIIGKIGLNELKTVFEADGLQNLIMSVFAKEKEKGKDDETSMISVGVSVSLELANTILSNLPKCEKEIYQLLAQTSNLSVDEITAPGNAVMFFEMLIDFIKKDEFKDFFKAASRLFK